MGGGKISNALPKIQPAVASVLIQNVQELIERETNSEIKDEAHSKVKGVTKLEEAENNSKPRAHVSKNPSPGPVLISTPESVTSDTLEPVQTTTPEPLKNLETVSIISPEPIKVPSPEPSITHEPLEVPTSDPVQTHPTELVTSSNLETHKIP